MIALKPHLFLEGVGVRYGGVTALHPLSLSVHEGEFFCLLGPSGCGKSTTLGAIAGFFPPYCGKIRLGDTDVTALSPQKRQIGVVFQSYALFPHMTAVQNIGYGLKLRATPADDIERKVSQLLALVHLEGKGDRLPAQLSGGEQQRVAIARAMAIEPRLLLLDEPLSNLDARLREEMQIELKRIQRETGITTVFVTHDQGEAFALGDRVAVLNNGLLEQVGTPSQIYHQPASVFVAEFIGRSNQWNVTLNAQQPSVLEMHGQHITHQHVLPASVTQARFFLRPEDISLGVHPTGANHVQAKIEGVTFAGAMVQYSLRSALGALMVCQLNDSTRTFSQGQDIVASWSDTVGALLPEPAGA